MELAQKKCSTYKPGSPPITRRDTVEILRRCPVELLQNGHLVRTFTFEDSEKSIEFLNDILTMSTEEGTSRISPCGKAGSWTWGITRTRLVA